MQTISHYLVATISIPFKLLPSGKELDDTTFDRHLVKTRKWGQPKLGELKGYSWYHPVAGYEYLRLISIAAARSLHMELQLHSREKRESKNLVAAVSDLAKKCFKSSSDIQQDVLKDKVITRLKESPIIENAVKRGKYDIYSLYIRKFSEVALGELLRAGVIFFPELYFAGSENFIPIACTSAILYYSWISHLLPDAHNKLKESSLTTKHEITISERNQENLERDAKKAMNIDDLDDPSLVSFRTGLENLKLQANIDSPFLESKIEQLNPPKPIRKNKENLSWEDAMEVVKNIRNQLPEESKNWYYCDVLVNEFAIYYYKNLIAQLGRNDPDIRTFEEEMEKADKDRMESKVLWLKTDGQNPNEYIEEKLKKLEGKANEKQHLKNVIYQTITRLKELRVRDTTNIEAKILDRKGTETSSFKILEPSKVEPPPSEGPKFELIEEIQHNPIQPKASIQKLDLDSDSDD